MTPRGYKADDLAFKKNGSENSVEIVVNDSRRQGMTGATDCHLITVLDDLSDSLSNFISNYISNYIPSYIPSYMSDSLSDIFE